MRLIDADALKDKIRQLTVFDWSHVIWRVPEALNNFIDAIDEMPTVDTIDHEQFVLKRHSVHEIKREDISNALSDFITLLINDLIEGKEDETD